MFVHLWVSGSVLVFAKKGSTRVVAKKAALATFQRRLG